MAELGGVPGAGGNLKIEGRILHR